MALVLSAGGCSFAFVDGPPPVSAPATTPANCTVSTFWPNVDLGLAYRKPGAPETAYLE